MKRRQRSPPIVGAGINSTISAAPPPSRDFFVSWVVKQASVNDMKQHLRNNGVLYRDMRLTSQDNSTPSKNKTAWFLATRNMDHLTTRNMDHLATMNMDHLTTSNMDHLVTMNMDQLTTSNMDHLVTMNMDHLVTMNMDHLVTRNMDQKMAWIFSV